MTKTYSLTAYTDYPIERLGDTPGQLAPIRKIKVIAYDGDKYCIVKVIADNHHDEIKAGYIYSKPGRVGHTPSIDKASLKLLPYYPGC